MNKKTAQKKERFFQRFWNQRGEETTFDEALDFLTAEARFFVLDAISCTLHNEGHSLKGNTDGFDDAWLARRIYAEFELNGDWDRETNEVHDRYLKIARVAIISLPALAGRIASRYLNLEKALNGLIRGERYYRWKDYTYADEKKAEEGKSAG